MPKRKTDQNQQLAKKARTLSTSNAEVAAHSPLINQTTRLSLEIWDEILKYLSLADLSRFAAVSKGAQTVVKRQITARAKVNNDLPEDVWGEILKHLTYAQDFLALAGLNMNARNAVKKKKFNLPALSTQVKFFKEQGIKSSDSNWLQVKTKRYDPRLLSLLQKTGFTMVDYPYSADGKFINALSNMLMDFNNDRNVRLGDFRDLISTTTQEEALDFAIYQNFKKNKPNEHLGSGNFLNVSKSYITSLIQAVSKIQKSKDDPIFFELNEQAQKIYQLQYPILLLLALSEVFRNLTLNLNTFYDPDRVTFLLVSALGMLHAAKFNMSYVAFFYHGIAKKLTLLKNSTVDIQNQKLLANIEHYVLGKLKIWCENNLPLTLRAYAQKGKNFTNAVNQVQKIISAEAFKKIALDSVHAELDALLSSPSFLGKAARDCTLKEIFSNNFLGLLTKRNRLGDTILDEFPNLTLLGAEELSNQPFGNLNANKESGFSSYGTVLCQDNYMAFLKLALKFEAPNYALFSKEKMKETLVTIMAKHHDKFEHLRSLSTGHLSQICKDFIWFMNFEKMYQVVTTKDNTLFGLYAVLMHTKNHLLNIINGFSTVNENVVKNAKKYLPFLNAKTTNHFENLWKRMEIELPAIQKYLKENPMEGNSFVLSALSFLDWNTFKTKLLSTYGSKALPAYQPNNPNNHFQPAPTTPNVIQAPVQTPQNNPTPENKP